MADVDLTPFGFTPTESRVYEVLLSGGPGTGYAIARSAGLARANTYSALEGLVTKGAARAEPGEPKIFRAEPPGSVLARVATAQGDALERLSRSLDGFGAADSPGMLELATPRGALQLLTQEIGRAHHSVSLIAPAEAYPLLAPVLRRAVSSGLDIALFAETALELPFVRVEALPEGNPWPGLPLVAVIDDRSAILAARNGAEIHGHWSSGPAFVAAARLTFDRFRNSL